MGSTREKSGATLPFPTPEKKEGYRVQCFTRVVGCAGGQKERQVVMIDYTDIVRKAGIAATSDQWGNVSYRTPDGWTVVAFYDCGEFDYIDSIISPDGIITDFDDLPPNLGIEE